MNLVSCEDLVSVNTAWSYCRHSYWLKSQSFLNPHSLFFFLVVALLYYDKRQKTFPFSIFNLTNFVYSVLSCIQVTWIDDKKARYYKEMMIMKVNSLSALWESNGVQGETQRNVFIVLDHEDTLSIALIRVTVFAFLNFIHSVVIMQLAWQD